jgi:hypothetical protein
MITGQVIDHVSRAKLVIADLSFANPNVYYELALRHATRKPIVQVIRTSDRLPFNVGQFRTVTIGMPIYIPSFHNSICIARRLPGNAVRLWMRELPQRVRLHSSTHSFGTRSLNELTRGGCANA